jgi:hypothetical protein
MWSLGQPKGETGSSGAHFWDFDDEVIRLVKWHPSVHGFTSTYSELIASRLGQLIDAPVVRGTVVHIDPDLLPPELMDKGAQPFHVGFTHLIGDDFSEADYDHIDNKLSLPKAAVQLAWLRIEDQQGHNQYLYRTEQILPDDTRRKKNHYVLVDQAAMCGFHDWREQDLKPDAEYTLPAPLRSRVSMSSVEPLLEHLASIEESEIRSCFDSHPDSWEITDEHVNKATEFVLERREHLEEVFRNNLVENV